MSTQIINYEQLGAGMLQMLIQCYRYGGQADPGRTKYGRPYDLKLVRISWKKYTVFDN